MIVVFVSLLVNLQTSSASPEFFNEFNPSDFLMSPVSPWDDLLTTPALDGYAGMTPDSYTSPALMSFGDDFDNLPSLFDTEALEGHIPNQQCPPRFSLRIFRSPTCQWTTYTRHHQ
ncbi:hypothetical protein F5148DRAFT_925391 [Russula earlei]|uniref:Uncharacterized protein n=1 Tax=Russula earlei TaxID=71964 RepID=A0ACC0U9I7_9AGAM|nr:hypothetical protein F5148DRAFT_925391 [Russula earlei]